VENWDSVIYYTVMNNNETTRREFLTLTGVLGTVGAVLVAEGMIRRDNIVGKIDKWMETVERNMQLATSMAEFELILGCAKATKVLPLSTKLLGHYLHGDGSPIDISNEYVRIVEESNRYRFIDYISSLMRDKDVPKIKTIEREETTWRLPVEPYKTDLLCAVGNHVLKIVADTKTGFFYVRICDKYTFDDNNNGHQLKIYDLINYLEEAGKIDKSIANRIRPFLSEVNKINAYEGLKEGGRNLERGGWAKAFMVTANIGLFEDTQIAQR